MDRHCQAASKVTDYRRYHLSGDLEQVVQGKVSGTVDLIENRQPIMEQDPIDDNAMPEQLQELLKEQKQNSSKLQQQLEAMQIKNELEAEQLQQEQWKLAIEQLKLTREQINQQHEENMEKIRSMASEPAQWASASQAVSWLQDQISKNQVGRGEEGAPWEGTGGKEPNNPRHHMLEQLHKQRDDIQRQMNDLLTEEEDREPTQLADLLEQAIGDKNRGKTEQELLLEQIRTALAPKETERDPNRALLRVLITGQNKATGQGGTSTLKPELLNKLSGHAEFSMAEWLASLNKQKEGESEVNRILNKLDDDSDCRAGCKHSSIRSGMLDKSTANIRPKEVWPQKNFGEDWAEEEIKFKQLRFEHLVAGETRTIETCSDPAQILGRLHLL